MLSALLGSLFTTVSAEKASTQRILFFGDSLTAGYGLDPSLAYPALIQKEIDAAGMDVKVLVGAVSGDTSAGGLRRIDWMLRQPVDVFVLALGANDGLRGIQPKTTETNLQKIIDRVKAKYPKVKVVIAGMLMPPSMGKEFTRDFAAVFPKIAKANNASLIPFLLEGVAHNPKLNLPDGIHPNVEGQQVLKSNVWKVLETLLATE